MLNPSRTHPIRRIAASFIIFTGIFASFARGESELKLATFDLDATPPVGSMMAYDPVRRIDELGLRCRGIVILGSEKPIVLCAVDWIGIANGAHDLFRKTLADAANTDVERVAVHCLHQHDAPRCDFSAEQLLHHVGASNLGPFESSFQRATLQRIEAAVLDAIPSARAVTHAGFGTALVDRVASNRRLLGADGNVKATRYTTCRDPELRAEPEGTIDPELSCLVFYDDENPIASLTYYACHPQSYYRTGVPSPDFPGIARILRGQDVPDTMHLHFNGAGGNIGAGKYNDGDKHNRMVLAGRVAEAMKQAFENAKRFPIDSDSIGWQTQKVSLPPAKHLLRDDLLNKLESDDPAVAQAAAANLAWLSRCESDHPIDVTALSVGNVRVLHLPGELFVEFQLAAKDMRDDLEVAMAAYGDYGPGYIGTEIAYGQGGYETSERASRVSPASETILMDAIKDLLNRDR